MVLLLILASSKSRSIKVQVLFSPERDLKCNAAAGLGEQRTEGHSVAE